MRIVRRTVGERGGDCKEIVKMDVILSKKIAYHIENLTYFNALNWFWRVEDLLEEKDLGI